jgi:hypothetical protein
VIAPSKPFDPTDPAGSYSPMPQLTVTDILEELVPAETRGKQIAGGEVASSCANESESFEYENVLIVRSVNSCRASKPYPENSASVYLKREICPKPKTQFHQQLPKS